MEQKQQLFYKKVKYFLFLIENGYNSFGTKIKLPDKLLLNDLSIKVPNKIKKFIIACESNNSIQYSEEKIKQILLDNFKLCDYFDWCDTFIHPFVNLNELNNMPIKVKKYIVTNIFEEINYHNKEYNNIDLNDDNVDDVDDITFEDQIKIMEFYCKYGSHSQIGYIKELTYLDKNEVYTKFATILKKKLKWISNIE